MRRTPAVRHAKAIVGWLILLAVVTVVVLFSLPRVSFWWGVGRHRTPVNVAPQAQLHTIDAALELFASEADSYPPSEANDVAGSPYCGAMKLAEAMLGKDLLGVHSRSVFRVDGLDPNGDVLYPAKPDEATLRVRCGPYLPIENANAYHLADIYGKGKTGAFPEETIVLCDTFVHKRPSGKKTGMPILYYRANKSGTTHDPNSLNNICDYRDNAALIALGVPGSPNAVHPLADPKRFYLNTQDVKASAPAPYRHDSYLLISAGYDGLYGTADDVCNFEWRYRESGAQE